MYVCGIDEVGRGALAGPLVAVAALFQVATFSKLGELSRKNSPLLEIDDSKNLSPTKRQEVFRKILRLSQFVDFGLGEIEVNEINEVGIEQANRRAFKRAVADLRQKPDFILIDGDYPLTGWGASQHNEPKADGLYWPVGAASILAKVIRDRYMSELSLDHPHYGWEKNSGYGTEYHRDALQRLGPCILHRTQFIRNILGEVRE